MRRSELFAGAFFCTLALHSGPSWAFCRTTTVKIDPAFMPGPGHCWDQGVPLWWRNACVGYSVARVASRQVSYDDASQLITRAFTRWTSATCTTDGTGNSRASIDVRDLGPVDCNIVQYNNDFGNQHVILFRDDGWPYKDASNTLALTIVSFNQDTGEIYDADMEINTFEHKVTLTDPVPSDGYDFASIVTHETGHFLGLAHSDDPHATMYARYEAGATAMRNLTIDDVTGICTVYQPDGNRLLAGNLKILEDSCDPTPRHGYTTQCAPQVRKGCTGNAVAPADVRGGASAWLSGAAAAVMLVLRRRRAQSASAVVTAKRPLV